MRARLEREPRPRRDGLLRGLQPERARDVRDMEMNVVLSGHRGGSGDRDRLRFGRTRLEHVLVRLEWPPERVQDPGILGMDHQGQAELRDRRSESRERAVIRRRLEVRVGCIERVQHLLAAHAERIAQVRLEPDGAGRR